MIVGFKVGRLVCFKYRGWFDGNLDGFREGFRVEIFKAVVLALLLRFLENVSDGKEINLFDCVEEEFGETILGNFDNELDIFTMLSNANIHTIFVILWEKLGRYNITNLLFLYDIRRRTTVSPFLFYQIRQMLAEMTPCN